MCAGLFAYKKNGETPPLTICYCCFDDCSIRVYAVSFYRTIVTVLLEYILV